MSEETTPIAKFLNEMITRRGLNKSQLAAYVGVSHVTVLRWLKGTYIPKPEHCRKIADVFRVRRRTVLEMAGHGDEAEEVPIPTEVVTHPHAETPIAIPIVEQPMHLSRATIAQGYVYLMPSEARGKRLVAVRTKGDCMQPAIGDGDTIIIDLDGSPNPGDIVVALVDGEEVEVKRLARRLNGKVILRCDNPTYPDVEVEDIKIQGVVIFSTKRHKS